MSTRHRLRASWDALQQRLQQNVETKSRSPSLFSSRTDIDEVDLAEDIADYYELSESTPLVHSSLTTFSSDVVAPGYRIQAEDDRAVEHLEDWAEQAAIVGGAKHNDLQPFLKQAVNQRWGRGGAMIEHVKDDPQTTDYDITGVHFIRPETVKAITQANQTILLGPDEESDDAPTTERGETAAFVQYHDDSLLGPFDDKDDVALSQNDVTRSLLNPDIDALWGTPVTEPIAEDVRGFKEILRANEEAIKGKAWGVWSVAFGREVLEYEDGGTKMTEIVEWSDTDQDQFLEQKIDDMSPGEIVGHDGNIEFDKHESDVPDIIDHLEFYISNIVTAMPTPLYLVGWEENINQFVTERQENAYQELITEERLALSRDLSPLLKEVVERNTDYDTEGITLTLEPAEDTSPILSHDSETIDRVETYAHALERLSGAADPSTLVDEEQLRDLILQLPDDAAPGPMPEVSEEDGEAATNEIEQLLDDD